MGLRRTAHFLLVASALFAVSACTFTENVETSLFDYRSVNLKESTYAAADMLSQQTKVHITPHTPLNITALTDSKAPNETSAFGEEIATQLSARFIQLGYNVQTSPMAPDIGFSSPASMPQPSGVMRPVQMEVKPSKPFAAVLGGTYTRAADRILVDLKVFQESGQNLLASYDYSLPLSPDVKNMAMTDDERARKEKYPVGWFLGLANE